MLHTEFNDSTEETHTRHMTEVEDILDASPAEVFSELSDGWGYASWVVGASHIRDVDSTWPRAGSRIHHQVGPWPLVIADSTASLECEQDRRLVLRARAWPVGEARVEIELSPATDRSTRVRMREAPSRGPARLMDNPAMRWVLKRRNIESLKRLKDRVENRERA